MNLQSVGPIEAVHIDPLHIRYMVVDGIPANSFGSCMIGYLCGQGWIVQELNGCSGQSNGVVRRRKQTILTVCYDVAVTAGIGGDHRRANDHSFNKCAAETLAYSWSNYEIAATNPRLNWRPETHEMHVRTDAQFSR